MLNSKNKKALKLVDNAKNTVKISSIRSSLSIPEEIISEPKKESVKKLSLFTDFFVPQRKVCNEKNDDFGKAGLKRTRNVQNELLRASNKITRIKEIKLMDKNEAAAIRQKLSDANLIKKPCLVRVFNEKTYNHVKTITKTYYSSRFIPNYISYKRICRCIYKEILKKKIDGNFIDLFIYNILLLSTSE